MAQAERAGPAHDLYRLLAVAPDATGQDIARAYRRRARALHPDSRPRDASAAAEFRVLAGAYEVLSDPARRAAYDRESRRVPAADPWLAARADAGTLAGQQPPWRTFPFPVPAQGRVPGAALWAGPVHIEPPAWAPGPARQQGPAGQQGPDVGITELARLLRSLWARRRDWPW
jgi:curved DNA-binding protein CbpA